MALAQFVIEDINAFEARESVMGCLTDLLKLCNILILLIKTKNIRQTKCGKLTIRNITDLRPLLHCADWLKTPNSNFSLETRSLVHIKSIGYYCMLSNLTQARTSP